MTPTAEQSTNTSSLLTDDAFSPPPPAEESSKHSGAQPTIPLPINPALYDSQKNKTAEQYLKIRSEANAKGMTAQPGALS